jgi:hypothetical protein
MTGSRDIQNGWILSGQASYLLRKPEGNRLLERSRDRLKDKINGILMLTGLWKFFKNILKKLRFA